MTQYELEQREADAKGFSLVELAGELDLTNAREVETRLDEIVDNGSGLVLDLNRVTFVDSAALHMLFRLARRFGEDKRLRIVLEPTALVARTLTIVGLDDVADVRSAVDEQVAEPSS